MDYSILSGHVPGEILNQLPDCQQLGATTIERISHLLGQSKHESGGFTKFVENLNYSGTALWSLFHTHFASQDEANLFARQPEKIANRIYSNRMGNGDEDSGDGWLHRGFGALQITGKTNQQAFFNSIGLDPETDPSTIAIQYQLLSAAWFFNERNLWAICDDGVNDDTIRAITLKINAGELGLAERTQYTNEFYSLLQNAVA